MLLLTVFVPFCFLFLLSIFTISVGAVTAFALDPAMVNIRLEKYGDGDTFLVAPEESAITVALISAITQMPCPTLDQDWKHIFENPQIKAYENFRHGLNELKMKIDERNKARLKNVDYHPFYCALSVSS